MFRVRRIRTLIPIFFLVTLAACHDLQMYAEYSSIREAQDDGAIKRGWIPDWIPPDAIDIHEFHDLDTSDQAISFSVNSPAGFVWPAQCSKSSTAPKPRLKTERFPNKPHKQSDIRACGRFFGVIAQDGSVHLWTR